MSEKVNISVTSYDKNKFQQTVNTQFTQFGVTATQSPIQTLSVNDFFNAYDSLFYQIPKLGETNSHEYLVKKSSAYIGAVSTNDEIQALLDEITQLRQDNLELQKTILTIQTPS
tara:strand:+ start:5401 stop:5742 length:342 start_codon:yes stop_codon:yes gene_type:complete